MTRQNGVMKGLHHPADIIRLPRLSLAIGLSLLWISARPTLGFFQSSNGSRQGIVIRSPSAVDHFIPPKSSTLFSTLTARRRRPLPLLRLQSEPSSPNAATQTAGPTKEQPPKSTFTNHDATARGVAVEAMWQSADSATFPVDKLESLPAFRQLSTRDRSFARLLVTTCVRRMGQIDKVLDLCSNQNNQSKQYNDSSNRGNANSSKGKAATPEVSQPKKPKRMNAVDRFVQAALRIGAVQILFEHVPHHAAVKETVDVLKQPVPLKHQHAEKTKNKNIVVPPAKIKYVNAVLRRLTREGHELLQNYTDVMDNAAPWFVDELVQAYGPLAARGVVQAAMEESPRCLTVKPPLASGLDDDNQIDQAHVHALAQLHFSNSTILPQGSLQINNPPSGKISDWPLYEEGAWWLQDVSATIPALALHSALRQRRDEKLVAASTRVVDLCAAPGGKTLQLCTWGYQVTAIEVSPRRSNRLGENVERVLQVKSDSANSNCKIVVADGCEWTPHEEDRGVHGVLIDAPCTATGTGSKRPDVLRKKQDYRELLETQYNLLCHAADHILAPGGVLVYATCSLLPQESEHQIQKFLARDKDDSSVQMRLLPFQAEEIPGFEECIDDKHGWLRIVPGSIQPSEVPHLDGFFVARLERVA